MPSARPSANAGRSCPVSARRPNHIPACQLVGPQSGGCSAGHGPAAAARWGEAAGLDACFQMTGLRATSGKAIRRRRLRLHGALCPQCARPSRIGGRGCGYPWPRRASGRFASRAPQAQGRGKNVRKHRPKRAPLARPRSEDVPGGRVFCPKFAPSDNKPGPPAQPSAGFGYMNIWQVDGRNQGRVPSPYPASRGFTRNSHERWHSLPAR